MKEDQYHSTLTVSPLNDSAVLPGQVASHVGGNLKQREKPCERSSFLTFRVICYFNT